MIGQNNSIQIAGQSYFAGLFWYPLEVVERKDAGNQLEKLLEEQHARVFVARGRPPMQVGLAGQEAQDASGAESIAANMAASLSQRGIKNALIALATDEPSVWFCLVLNQGLIQFDGDFVGSYEQVRQRLKDSLSMGIAWELIVAPPEWEIPGSVQNQASELLTRPGLFKRSKDDFRLRTVEANISYQPTFGPVLVLSGLVVCLYMGATYFLYKDGTQRLDRVQKEAQAEQERFVVERPWRDRPAFKVWAPLCVKTMVAHMVSPAGWQIAQMHCDPLTRSLSVTLRRLEGGLLSDLHSVYPQARLASPGAEPASATLSIAVEAPATEFLPAAPSELMDMAGWEQAASNWSERWRDNRPSITGDKDAFVWTWTEAFPPFDAIAFLSFPASVLGSVALTVSDTHVDTWTTSATHYVRK